MATTNNSASQPATLPPKVVSFAPIYQVSSDVTAVAIGNHIDMQLDRLHSMLLALTGSNDPLEDLTESVRAAYLYACVGFVEEVIDLRELVTYGERAKLADTKATA